MNEPWGISGPDFLGLYLICLGATLLYAFAVRIITRSGAGRESEPRHESVPSTTELAFLAGGRRRTIETAVARLVDGGRLRPSRDGGVTGYVSKVPGATGSDPVERTVLAEVTRYGTRSLRLLVERVRDADAVTEVGERLVRAGLLVDPRTAHTRRLLGMLPTVVLLAVGTLRWMAEIQAGAAVTWLFPLLAGTVGVLVLLHRQPTFLRTFVGDTVLAGAREAVADSSATAVAIGGLEAHPDQTIRRALTPPPVSRASASVTVGGTGGGTVTRH